MNAKSSRDKLRRLTPARILGGIVILGAAALIMPASWIAFLKGLVQPLWLAQKPISSVADKLSFVRPEPPTTLSLEEYDNLIRANQRLLNALASKEMEIQQLRRENLLLRQTRAGGIGLEGKLIPAKIIGGDLAVWRSSGILDQGRGQGLRPGDPVSSRQFTIDAGARDGAAPGMAALYGEVLVGALIQADALTSRAQLVTDPRTRMKARVGRIVQDELVALTTVFWLQGLGGDEMEIRDVVLKDVQTGRIQVNDRVLAAPGESRLPIPMTVGTVSEIRPDRQNPLLAILIVKPPIPAAELRNVYVYVPASPDPGQ